MGTLEEAVLHNTNQFQRWHSELEAACASEMEEKYKRYADLLNSHLKSCEGILGQVRMRISPAAGHAALMYEWHAAPANSRGQDEGPWEHGAGWSGQVWQLGAGRLRKSAQHAARARRTTLLTSSSMPSVTELHS